MPRRVFVPLRSNAENTQIHNWLHYPRELECHPAPQYRRGGAKIVDLFAQDLPQWSGAYLQIDGERRLDRPMPMSELAASIRRTSTSAQPIYLDSMHRVVIGDAVCTSNASHAEFVGCLIGEADDREEAPRSGVVVDIRMSQGAKGNWLVKPNASYWITMRVKDFESLTASSPPIVRAIIGDLSEWIINDIQFDGVSAWMLPGDIPGDALRPSEHHDVYLGTPHDRIVVLATWVGREPAMFEETVLVKSSISKPPISKPLIAKPPIADDN